MRGCKLQVSLEFNVVICDERALHLTPTQAEILSVLVRDYPNIVRKSKLFTEVWGINSASANSMRTLLYQTRKQIEKLGFTILPATTRGYRLAPLP